MSIDIDTKNMPSYLSESLINDWYHEVYKQIEPLIDYLNDEHWLSNIKATTMIVPKIKITFSTKKKKDIYGTLSLKQAKDKIKKIFPQEEVKKILKSILPILRQGNNYGKKWMY